MRAVSAKLAVFAVVMGLLTAMLFVVFAQVRGGEGNSYTAVFADVSDLNDGDSVRVSGVRVGTVDHVALQSDKTILVSFDADRQIALTTGTKAMVRYLNLTGDRYLELVDGPGSTRTLSAGAQIPLDRTAPALDLDLLLGGLKPVIQGLNPQDVNALTAALIQIMQGQGGTIASLLSRTSSFTSALADNSQIIEALIDNLNGVMATLDRDGAKFSATVDNLQHLVSELSEQREPIGAAIDSLSAGTASLADLLTQARPPLAATVDQLNRLAGPLNARKDLVDTALQKAPENYRKLVRTGSYGSFFNYYICGITFRVSDLQGRTAVFPWFRQDGGRCAEP
jgi:phospholipid/cholesterol/gamma-HCH transport system substrate-binding protein